MLQMLQQLDLPPAMHVLDADCFDLPFNEILLREPNPPPIDAAITGAEDEVYTQQRQRHAAAGLPYRVALFSGCLQPYYSDVAEWCEQLGMRAAIFWPADESMRGRTVQYALQHAVASHASLHDIVQPWRTDTAAALPAFPRVTLSARVCRGQVGVSLGGRRWDESHVVVLDGLLTAAERAAILDSVTEPGWDHSQGPPPSKWELSCCDRAGAQPTWGLSLEAVSLLRRSPPPGLVALQSRLQALYPEYVVSHMPAAALEAPGSDDAPLSPFVGNAVVYGDPCAYHIDMDPEMVPAGSPWLEQFGWYTNREEGKPLFVSVLLYLDEHWPDEFHAETLVLDEAAQVGLSIRPKAGRVVLMDQDCPHRISSPAAAADRPRYSLVWKTVFFPKGLLEFAPRAGSAAPLPGLCREEWGPPALLGTCAEVYAVPILPIEA